MIWIREHLWKSATAFRKAIEEADRTQWEDYLRDFPRGTCGPVSELLGGYLQEVLGRQPLYICGERHSPDFQTHAWLVCDGFVVDITADQFGQPPVIVARQSPWHDEWEQGPGRPPIITADQWPHYPSRAWAKIVAKLEKSPLHAEPHP